MAKPVCIGCQRNDQVVKHKRPAGLSPNVKTWGCIRCGLEWDEDQFERSDRE